MKRANRAFALLSDPERRVKYDAQLAEAASVDQSPGPSPQHRRLIPVRAIITLGWLICAFAGAIGIGWYVSEQSATPPVTQISAPPVQVVPARVAPEPTPAAQSSDAQSSAADDRTAEVDSLRSELAAAKAERDHAIEQLTLQNKELDFLTSRIAALPQPSRAGCARFSGVWVLPKSRITPVVSSAYTPEAVDLIVSEREGAIQGRYRARYPGMGTVEAPVVHFYFEGKCQDDMVNAVWNAEGGRGEIQLRLAADGTLQLVWTLPDAGAARGPTSGTLLLVRKREVYSASNFAAPASRNQTTSLPSRVPN